MNTATLLTCISILTGYPIPEEEPVWVEVSGELIFEISQKTNLPNAYGIKALYFAPRTVFYEGEITRYIYLHETTHHFQHHAGVTFSENRAFTESQAHCVGQFGPWCNKPIPGYCK